MLRWAGTVALLLLAALALVYLYIHRNNLNNNAVDVPVPTPAEYSQAFDRVVRWAISEKPQLLRNHSPYLWWYVQQSALISGDARLQALVAEYLQQRYTENKSRDIGSFLLLPEPNFEYQYDAEQFESQTGMAQAIIYAGTCNEQAANAAYIRSLYQIEHCDKESARDVMARCVTHQMALLYLIERSSCPTPYASASLVPALQAMTRDRMLIDPRIGDPYYQRVVWLLLTGAQDYVKPVWLRRILDVQQRDGGWLPFQDIAPAGPGLRVGMGLYGPRLKRGGSTFHSTAQVMLLLALLLDGNDGGQGG